jgi:hypothetical protein
MSIPTLFSDAKVFYGLVSILRRIAWFVTGGNPPEAAFARVNSCISYRPYPEWHSVRKKDGILLFCFAGESQGKTYFLLE